MERRWKKESWDGVSARRAYPELAYILPVDIIKYNLTPSVISV